ncbi:MAG: hypothetical protein ISS15_10205 [Alphaproteobacteria bacterium]|nr:hypothetical protein [Alphaproteobacteria bacterium]MBL7098022.1 hypothetical protein [Alphaproteobacteria bacterium]
MVRWLLVLLTLPLLSACGFVHEQTLVARYHLVAVDVYDDMMLCWSLDKGDCAGLAGPTVYAAGFNDKYVVAASHPAGARTLGSEFTIISREPNREDSENGEPRKIEVIKDPAQYASLKARLNLPDFTVAFDELK